MNFPAVYENLPIPREGTNRYYRLKPVMYPFASIRPSALVAVAVLLAACSTEHEFRVDAVGDSSAQEASSAALDVPRYLVVGGNVLLGTPAQRVTGPGLAALPGQSVTGPSVTGQSGTVSTVFLTTGESLVQLDSGTQVLVGAIGGLDTPVSLDPTTGQVLGLASSALEPITTSNVGGLSLAGAGPGGLISLVSTPTIRGTERTVGSVSPVGLLTPGSTLPVGTGDPIGGLCC